MRLDRASGCGIFFAVATNGSPTIRKNLARISKKQTGVSCHSIEEGENRKDALARVAADATDLVASDLNLPEMTGIEIVRALGGGVASGHPSPRADSREARDGNLGLEEPHGWQTLRGHERMISPSLAGDTLF